MGPGWDHHHGRTSRGVADSTGGILVGEVWSEMSKMVLNPIYRSMVVNGIYAG